ncbi:MAG: ribosome silencing factor [Wenzhouxiangellaceae bacterium]
MTIYTDGVALASDNSVSDTDLLQCVTSLLDDYKARDVQVIDVRGISSLSDYVILATGTSTRHLQAVAENLVVGLKRAGYQPLGVEGQRDSDWVLVDADDVIVHLMLPQAREFYNLEKLWDVPRARSAEV